MTKMAKQSGRNDPCPCGSGNKYKKCCLPKEEAAANEVHAKEQAEREARAAAERQRDQELRAEMAEECELAHASNAVVDLVKSGNLDEAEAAARDLLESYPDVHDGWDRLGMVHEARGQNREAADCYRKALGVIQEHADDYDPEFANVFVELIAKLDPTAPG